MPGPGFWLARINKEKRLEAARKREADKRRAIFIGSMAFMTLVVMIILAYVVASSLGIIGV